MRPLVLLLLATSPALASDLAGAASCRACHEEAYRIWSQGPHARAVDSLTPEQRRMPLCLSCHSRDEQRSDRADPVVGVSCETCHGGGRFYQPAEVMRDRELARLFGLQDAQATCLSCHGPGSASPQPFDVKTGLKRIDHWSKDRAARAQRDGLAPDASAADRQPGTDLPAADRAHAEVRTKAGDEPRVQSGAGIRRTRWLGARVAIPAESRRSD